MIIVAKVSMTTATRTFLAVARSAMKSLSDWVAFLILPNSPFSLSLSTGQARQTHTTIRHTPNHTPKPGGSPIRERESLLPGTQPA